MSSSRVVFIGLLALLLVACQRPGGGAAGNPAATASAPLLIAPEDMRTLTAGGAGQGPVITGSIQPARRADLRAEVSAVVMAVPKENGETVKSGDLLVRLDDTAIRDGLT